MLIVHGSVIGSVPLRGLAVYKKVVLTKFGRIANFALVYTVCLCISELQESPLAKKTVKLSLLGEVDELEPAVLYPIELVPASELLFEDKDEDDSKLLE